jgi:hypothetical protein
LRSGQRSSAPARAPLSARRSSRIWTQDFAHLSPITHITECRRQLQDHSGLMPANLITLAHFSVSSNMNFPN